MHLRSLKIKLNFIRKPNKRANVAAELPERQRIKVVRYAFNCWSSENLDNILKRADEHKWLQL